MSTSTPTRSHPRGRVLLRDTRYNRAPTFAIAYSAEDESATRREAVLALGVSVAEFERIVDPATMVGHPRRDLGLDDRPAG